MNQRFLRKPREPPADHNEKHAEVACEPQLQAMRELQHGKAGETACDLSWDSPHFCAHSSPGLVGGLSFATGAEGRSSGGLYARFAGDWAPGVLLFELIFDAVFLS